ncbi:hypothetical protein HYALB_00008551 [Hymenoscyphus albidus]|uniref:Uncharacterized protein n=1 Tax=Hymenoscyphus albidus TaxID=595503 RepID=A0A9N9LK42_9HELO|nr:hypothetical protein HYALB_00008551 [Hymenoscyphus albidus]
MAPARFKGGRRSPNVGVAQVHKTYSETFNAQILALQLDQEDPIVSAANERKRIMTMFADRESVKEDSRAARIFKNFPTELHEKIVKFLPHDRDVASYMLICKSSGSAICDFVWRMRFEEKYDLPRLPTGSSKPDTRSLAIQYRCRQLVLSQYTTFNVNRIGGRIDDKVRLALIRKQQNCLDLLKDLLIESNACVVEENGIRKVSGQNIDVIRNMVSYVGEGSHVDILDAVLCTSHRYHKYDDIGSTYCSDTLVFVIQLALTPLSLDPSFATQPVAHFDLSQSQVYATAKTQPVFVGKYKQYINALWLLNCVNHFKFHLKTRGDGLLSQEYYDLEPHLRPQFWTGLLKSGTRVLKRHWKGAHSFVNLLDLDAIRNDRGRLRDIYQDDGDDALNDFVLVFDEQNFPSKKWPEDWDHELCSNPYSHPPTQTGTHIGSARSSPRKRRRIEEEEITKPESMSFYGTAGDINGNGTAFMYGQIHSLPEQHGIPGFQRIVMKRFGFINDMISPDRCYNYEGCVFPGGTIMAGRWWTAGSDPTRDSTYSGPFLWWSCEDSVEEDLPAPADDIIELARLFMG